LINLLCEPSVRLRRYARYHPELKYFFQYPVGYWIGIPDNGNLDNIHIRAQHIVKHHKNCNPIIVIYSIPDRDFSGIHSAGGCDTNNEYLQFIDIISREFAKGADPIIIMEPDALPAVWNKSHLLRQQRTQLISEAVDILTANINNPHIYLDIGNPMWILDTYEAGEILLEAGVSKTKGFALNVSNFFSTEDCTYYGEQIATMINKNYIIDTSRNGNGHLHKDAWCNPPGRKLGIPPTFDYNDTYVDACLWIKPPTESDGECNGGPKPGDIWPEYAVSLINVV
jgi:endoglucanase